MNQRDKVRGAFVGLAIGDALGAPVEFGFNSQDIISLGDKIEHFSDSIRLPKGVWTDDTEMALCLADSLIEKQGYDSYDVMERYYRWIHEGYRTYDGNPASDVGIQTNRAIDLFRDNPVIHDGDLTESAGNGPIMRLAPAIIANTENTLENTLDIAKYSCFETHNSIGAMATTELMAAALRLLINGEDKTKVLEQAIQSVKDPDLKDFLDREDHLHNRIFDKTGNTLRDLGGYILDGFDIAMWGLINFSDFKSGLLGIIRLGGDTDTNGAIYGQLAGAYYGLEKIPNEWKNEVYRYNELIEIADKLYDLKTCKVLKTRFENDKYFKMP